MAKKSTLDELETVFRRFYRQMVSDWSKKVEGEISGSQAMILERLISEGPQKPTELAAMLDITVSAVTSLSDKLVRAKLVERRRSDEDRRAGLLLATPAAEGVLQRVRAQRYALFQHYFQGLSEQDMQHLVRIFHTILGTH